MFKTLRDYILTLRLQICLHENIVKDGGKSIVKNMLPNKSNKRITLYYYGADEIMISRFNKFPDFNMLRGESLNFLFQNSYKVYGYNLHVVCWSKVRPRLVYTCVFVPLRNKCENRRSR